MTATAFRSEAQHGPWPALAAGSLPMLYWFFRRIDQQRRWQGRLLDLLGFGPRQQPARAVLRQPGMQLNAYAEAAGAGPVVLLIPAPIKRAYLWDLAPGASVVERLLAGGVRPYLLHWEEPDPQSGLADYVARQLVDAVQAIRAETGETRIFLAGHSLGGLFAAVFAGLYPALVRGAVIIGAPLHFEFGPQAGALGPAVARIVEGDQLESLPGNLPGSLLSAASHSAAAAAFGEERQRDWLASLNDAAALATHQRVERWCLDELPLARALVIDLVRQLYAECLAARNAAPGGASGSAGAVCRAALHGRRPALHCGAAGGHAAFLRGGRQRRQAAGLVRGRRRRRHPARRPAGRAQRAGAALAGNHPLDAGTLNSPPAPTTKSPMPARCLPLID